MSDVNIDKLQIEVEASAEKAESNLDKLIKKLQNFSQTIRKTTGLDRISKQIDKINESVNRITGTAKLEKLTATIDKLKNMQSPNVTKTVNAIKRLAEASNSIGSISGTEKFASNIQAISEACKPMENMGKNTLAPFLNSLKKIPEITEKLDTSTIKEFADRIKSLTAGLSPLTTEVQKSEKGLTALNSIIKATTASNGNLASSNAAATRSFTSLGGILNSIKVKFAAYGVIGHKVGSIMSECFDSSNDYVENLNLFSVTMGEAADSALEYAQTVNDLLGIDVSEWIRNQGVFKQITSGFGVATEKANLMSQNLTQIGYDIASFFNIDTEDAMLKVQSGISGELEPLRRLGYALDAATLQQIAYNNGITQNINTMTQAQKSQLRYIAILQQSTNVMGDMARTIVTPANSMRILGQQIEQLKRAFGNIVSVIAAKVIPYIQVAVRLLTDLGNYLADKMGFELPKIDYSGVSDGISSVTNSAEEATEAISQTAEELNWLAGFDEITKIPSADNNSSGSDDNALNNFDLGIDLPEYDFLKDLDAQTNDLYEQVKKQLQDLYKWWQKHKTIIKTIAGLIAGLWVLNKAKKFIGFIGDLWQGFKDLFIIKDIRKMLGNFLDGFKSSKATTFLGKLKDGFAGIRSQLSLIQKIGIGAVFGTIAGISSYDFFKKLSDKTLTWKDALKDTAFFLGSISAAFIIGGPIAGAITIVGGLTGAFVALYNSEKDAYNELTGLYDNGGVKISDITDLFSEQYDKVIETSKKVEEYVKLISDNKGEIKTAADNISDFNKAFGATGEYKMSEDDLEYIQTQFEKISEAIKENIGTATQGILDSFSDKIGKVAETTGTNLDTLIGSLKGFESEMMSNVDEAEKTVTDYQEMLFKGITPTKEQTEEYERSYSYLLAHAKETSTELSKAKDDMANAVDFSKIDFEDPDTAIKSLDTLASKYNEVKNAIDTTYEGAYSSLQEYFNNVQLDYQYGFLTDEQYDVAMKTYEDTKKLLMADKEQSLKDLENDYATLTGAIQSQMDESVKNLAIQQAGWQAGLWGKYDNINYEILENFKKNNSEWWNELLEDETWKAEHNMKEFRYTLQKNADSIDIKPNVDAGKAWLEQIGENGKLVLPSVISECNSLSDLWNQNNIKHMGYNIEKFGLKTSDMYKSTATKNFDVYNDTFVGKSTAISSTLDTFGKKISEQLSKVDLQAPAINTVNNFSSALSDGIKRTKPAVVNNFVDVYNEILDRTDTFNVKLMDTFNSAIPQFQSMGNTLASLAGSASMQISGINYTAPGYRVQGYASGGFPKKHQLFIARENGIPEMVGRIGNQTAVANNDQITEAIFKAVYSAVKEGSNDSNVGSGSSSKQPIYIMTPNNKVLMKAVVDEVNGEIRRTGKSPIKST